MSSGSFFTPDASGRRRTELEGPSETIVTEGLQFEGSYLGDAGRIADDAVLECGVCWWVYDPAKGDEVWHIDPDTPFSQLPDHWRCPNCDNAKDGFMVIKPGDIAEDPPAAPVVQDEALDPAAKALVLRITNAYRAARTRMQDLSVCRKDLSVETVGFQRVTGGLVGVVVTPWSMVILHAPLAPIDAGEGEEPPTVLARPEEKVTLTFPSGDYEFVGSDLNGVGPVATCSLFSPMQSFEDQAAALAVARACAEALFEEPQEDAAEAAAAE